LPGEITWRLFFVSLLVQASPRSMSQTVRRIRWKWSSAQTRPLLTREEILL